MSENVILNEPVVQEDNAQSVSQDIPKYTDAHVNNIVRQKLGRQKEHYERMLEERQYQHTPLIDENLLIEKAKLAAQNEFMQQAERFKQEAIKKQEEAALHKNAQNYWKHIQKLKGEEIEDECNLLSDASKYADLNLMAGALDFEDTADIYKELAKNPGKLMDAAKAAERNDQDALKAIFKRISGSIKKNKESLENVAKVQPPLKTLKSSSTGSVNAQSKNVSDFKNESWLRA